ncbi:MAG: respiratory nitrate reductase subunit gamma [Gammaproteobacteria bacterium]|nr:respiratory nitrate reductase subunit gamma [Gammaproteobacteria bacterium]
MELFSNANDFLLWVRGDAFNIALGLFIIGVLVRILEIFLLGRKKDFSEARGTQWGPGLRNIVSRSVVDNGTFKRAPFVVVVGYIWHICFFIVLFLFIPHIELINALLGIQWPGLASQLVDAATVVAMVSLVAMLWHRLTHPVLKFLSTYEDYVVWFVTFLPLLTGYMAFHRMIDPYPLALGLHILSVELLMVIFPFTKLMHAFTLFIARWYTGAMMGRKGIVS